MHLERQQHIGALRKQCSVSRVSRVGTWRLLKQGCKVIQTALELENSALSMWYWFGRHTKCNSGGTMEVYTSVPAEST